TFQVFRLRRSFTFAQLPFDIVRTTFDKRRGLFVLDNSSDENSNRFTGPAFGRPGVSRIVEYDCVCRNRLNARIAHIISEAICSKVAAQEQPLTGEQTRKGRKVGRSGYDRTDTVYDGVVNIVGGQFE